MRTRSWDKVAPRCAVAAALALCSTIPAAQASTGSAEVSTSVIQAGAMHTRVRLAGAQAQSVQNLDRAVTAIPPPPMEGDLDIPAPGIGYSNVTGEEVSVWGDDRFKQVAAYGDTGAALDSYGRLFMWGALRVDHGQENMPVPAQIKLPADLEPSDVSVFDGEATLLDYSGELHFVHLTRDDDGAGTLVGEVSEQEQAAETPSVPVWNCKAPFASGFIDDWVRDADGNLCELVPEANQAYSDSYMPRMGGEPVESVVMLGDRINGAGAVVLTEDGELFSLEQDEDALAVEQKKSEAGEAIVSPAQWNATSLGVGTQWKGIVPNPDSTGVLAVTEDGQVRSIDAATDEATPIETSAAIERTWFTQEKHAERAYLWAKGGVLYAVQTGNSAGSEPLEPVEMEDSELAGQEIYDMGIGQASVAVASDGRVFTWGDSGVSSATLGNLRDDWAGASIPHTIGPGDGDTIIVDGTPVTLREQEKIKAAVMDAPAHTAGTVPVAVESNGEEIVYGDFTYVIAPEIRLSNVRDVNGDLQRADVTLTVPKDARDYLATAQLYVVARSSSLLPFAEEESTPADGSEPAPARSMPIDFDDDGEAHLLLNFPSESEQSLVVVAESTPRDKVDARIGMAVDFHAAESGPGVWVYTVAVLGAAAVAIIGFVVVRRRQRRRS